jgi:hypothetical protein
VDQIVGADHAADVNVDDEGEVLDISVHAAASRRSAAMIDITSVT